MNENMLHVMAKMFVCVCMYSIGVVCVCMYVCTVCVYDRVTHCPSECGKTRQIVLLGCSNLCFLLIRIVSSLYLIF